jgi:transposase
MRPKRLVADRGYDSRALWARLQRRGIDLVVPHRRGRRQGWQDGRKLRRYRRRWIVERTIAWLLSFKRLVVRCERRLDLYCAFVHVACLLITLRRL